MVIGVTGSTGFVGLELVRQLIADGHQVRAWHRPSSNTSLLQNLANSANAELELIAGSLEDLGDLSWMSQCDAVVHSGLWRESASFQAAPSSVSKYAEINIVGSLRLIEAAIEHNVGKFVFVSTCAVHDIILNDRRLDEAHPLWAKTHYGAHKAAIEKFVHSFGHGTGFPICALRPTGIYGLKPNVEESKWYALIRSVSRSENIKVGKGGKEVHVSDVAQAIRLLLNQDDQAITGQSFACYDRYISEFDVATITKKLTGSTSAIEGEQRQPKHEIEVEKIKSLGMTFGGRPQLEKTIQQILTSPSLL